IVNSRFVGNRASNSGGGASISATFPDYPKFQVVISGTEFISNTAVCTSFSCSLHGGGLRIFELDAVISHSRFENNRCAGESERCTGGGLAHSQAFNPVSLTLQETDFISNSAQYNGGGVSFDATFADTLQVSGGRFISNSVVITEVTAFGGEGGGLFVRDAAAVITGTEFINNTALRLGGGLYTLGPAEIRGALFQANQVRDGHGGGGAFEFVGAVAITETVWMSNTAALNGGGVYGALPLEISGGRFEGNRSLGGDSSGNLEGGGGIYATQPLTLTHVDFVNNRANQNGGAIMMLNGQPLRIDGGRFEQNAAAGQGLFSQRGGGGLFIVGDVAAVETVFISNTAVLTNSFNTLNSGGAGYIFGSAVLDRVQVLENAAYNAGGGFYVSAGLVMTDSLFSGNEALAFNGGGAFVSGDITVSDSDFIYNTAGGSGGAIAVSQGDVVLEQTMVYSNTAVSSGGGLSIFGGVGGVTATITSAEFQHNTVTVGAGAGASIFVGIGGQTLVSDTLWAYNTAVGNGGALSLDTA
ncbi:MAG: hypothetical protein KDE51_18770, partial [Anaerolineales bacterium]|nr:hypothetical protein [Anaerolineales bacterium]